MLRRTALGLALHAAGAEPRAVDKSGLSVTALRYGAVLFTGVMAALAGCFLSIGDIHTFTEGMTSGSGYLAIAAIIFGNWKLGRMLLACLLFGAATALQFSAAGHRRAGAQRAADHAALPAGAAGGGGADRPADRAGLPDPGLPARMNAAATGMPARPRRQNGIHGHYPRSGNE